MGVPPFGLGLAGVAVAAAAHTGYSCHTICSNQALLLAEVSELSAMFASGFAGGEPR